jgi:hypothetical protein
MARFPLGDINIEMAAAGGGNPVWKTPRLNRILRLIKFPKDVSGKSNRSRESVNQPPEARELPPELPVSVEPFV